MRGRHWVSCPPSVGHGWRRSPACAGTTLRAHARRPPGDTRRRGARRRDHPRPAPSDTHLQRALDPGRALPQGRAAAAHRLLQAARRAHEPRRARPRGAGAGCHLRLRGQPRAGPCLGCGAGGDRRLARHVARRKRGEGGRDPCLRGGGRPRGRRPRRRLRPPRGVDRPRPAGCSCIRSTLRARSPARGRSGSRSWTISTASTRSSSRAAEAVSSRGSPWRASPPACAWWRSSRKARRRCTTGWRPGSRCP